MFYLQIYGWVPEYYNTTDSLPEEMPNDLKKYIRDVARTKPHEVSFVI